MKRVKWNLTELFFPFWEWPLQAGISCISHEDWAQVPFLSTVENQRTSFSKAVNLGHLKSLEILINVSETHKEVAFKCCGDRRSINSCKCLWRGRYLETTGQTDRGPFSPSPLAVLWQGCQSSAGMRLQELCSKISRLSLTPGHLQRFFPWFISSSLSQWILRHGQNSVSAAGLQCDTWQLGHSVLNDPHKG